mmetsp:Transcript_39781/g.127183  ORF Transcript_39781/g.127183 Transcript_39781/m.127183 type:complete len:160 (-) Transcript_39781:710-1189(-)
MAVPPKLLTLLIPRHGPRVLLGAKKRGFGEGFYNGFGGKVEAGESILEAANRELREEAGIASKNTTLRGILTFKWEEKAEPWEVHVFHASSWDGEPVETDEMRPEWFDIADIPYEKMWADDVHWYPLFLSDKRFRGEFLFRDTTVLVSHTLGEVGSLER